MNKEEQPGVRERIATGVPGLDDVLHGGFIAGSVHIVEGPPGAGKTIFANQICYHHVERYGPALYVTLLAESHDALLGHLHSMSFYRPAVIPEKLSYLSAFDVLVKDGLRGVLSLLRTASKKQRASFVVLDGLFVLEESIGSDPQFRKFINDLATLAKLMGTTVLLLTNSSHRSAGLHPEYTMVDGWIELDRSLEDYRPSRTLCVHKFRGSNHLGGLHQVKITDQGIRVLPRLEAMYGQTPRRHRPAGRCSSGLDELDELLGGGVPRVSSTLILGPSGVGKTVLGLHYIAASTPEEPGLIFTCHESPEQLLEMGDRLGLGLRAKAGSGAVDIIWTGQPEALVDELGHRLLEAVQARSVRRLLVDSVAGFQQALFRPGRLQACLSALSQELAQRGVTTWFTADGEMLADAPAIGVLSGNIIHLRCARGRSQERTVAIQKLQLGGFDTAAHAYRIDDGGFHISALPVDGG